MPKLTRKTPPKADRGPGIPMRDLPGGMAINPLDHPPVKPEPKVELPPVAEPLPIEEEPVVDEPLAE